MPKIVILSTPRFKKLNSLCLTFAPLTRAGNVNTLSPVTSNFFVKPPMRCLRANGGARIADHREPERRQREAVIVRRGYDSPGSGFEMDRFNADVLKILR
jgi:hypothetical protein